MPLLTNAHNVVINDGQLIDHSQSQTIAVQNNFNGLSGVDILLGASIPEAAHDSSARDPPPKCFPGTREQYVEDITHWAASPLDGDSLPMYWMKGPAGVGKSAVAQTCAEKLKELGQLGAAFFFSINGRDDHTRFFPSLAYQLCVEFPDYRNLVNAAISVDKTIVTKRMSSQFNALFVKPIQDLERAGKGIGRRAIFIDGLDECDGRDAQCEIVEIIAASARERRTPFLWAFFSRPEPHIEAIFTRDDIALLCHQTLLPISREIDGEIELYLRNGLGNILQRRNIPMPHPWPSDDIIQTLVNAAAGLFIYGATVVMFVGSPSSQGPEELLPAVLDVTSERHHNHLADPGEAYPFAELDAFYTLIMQRIPTNIRHAVQLVLAHMCLHEVRTIKLSTIQVGNSLRFSEAKFRTICNELYAVLSFEEHRQTLEIDASIDITRPFYQCPAPSEVMALHLAGTYSFGGLISFHHKSFYDFLTDTNRSGVFCATTQPTRDSLLKQYLEVHLHYVQTFDIHNSELILASNMPSSASSLSWPYPNEFLNSYLKVETFCGITTSLLRFLPEVNLDHQLQQELVGLDYRKVLLAERQTIVVDVASTWIFGCWCYVKGAHGMLFHRIISDDFDDFDITKLYEEIERLLKLKVIRPYSPNLASRCKSLLRRISRNETQSGLYIKGYGTKKTFWYWEYNPELRYFNQYEAIDYEEASRIYREEQFELWDYRGLRDGSSERFGDSSQ